MAEVLEIPLNADDPSFKIRTILEEVEIILRFDWNTRLAKWHLSIYDPEENPIALGLPMNVNQELISRLKINGLPPGQILLYDTSGATVDECDRDGLGDRFKLLYQASE